MNDELREQLAALAHESWSGWWEYAFSKGTLNSDGTLTLPAWAVERWTRQMRTPYADLPEEEKDSDRAEADRVLAILKAREPVLPPAPQRPCTKCRQPMDNLQGQYLMQFTDGLMFEVCHRCYPGLLSAGYVEVARARGL